VNGPSRPPTSNVGRSTAGKKTDVRTQSNPRAYALLKEIEVKITLHVYKQQWEWEHTHEILASSGAKMDDTEYRVYLGMREVDIEVDEHTDMRPLQIAALRAQKERVMAEAQSDLNLLEEKIQKLLAISHEPVKAPV